MAPVERISVDATLFEENKTDIDCAPHVVALSELVGKRVQYGAAIDVDDIVTGGFQNPGLYLALLVNKWLKGGQRFRWSIDKVGSAEEKRRRFTAFDQL